MISYVKGILAEKAKDRIVVEYGMMGIGIFVPMSVLEVLPPLGEEVKIYTHLQVREDDMSLYVFLSRSDLEMFRQLLGVNGIGPKDDAVLGGQGFFNGFLAVCTVHTLDPHDLGRGTRCNRFLGKIFAARTSIPIAAAGTAASTGASAASAALSRVMTDRRT